MRHTLVVLQVFGLTMLTLMCVITTHGPGGAKPPIPAVLRVKHAIFKESCSIYANFTAENVCCRTRKYTESDILECIRNSHDKHESHWGNSSSPTGNATDAPVHIAIVGDSHMRNLFVATAQRVKGKRLEYRAKAVKNSWAEATTRLQQMRSQKFGQTTEVRHLDVPFRVTWYQDWQLKKLPDLIHFWEANEEARPTIVVIAAALHWMKNSPHPQGTPYKTFLKELVPYLKRLASAVPVYFKLVDLVSRAHFILKKYPGINPEAFPLYNAIAREVLQDTGVVIWDNTVPLSYDYIAECLKVNRNTPVTFDWICRDNGHVGFILVEQYTDMIYNALCNRFLNLSQEYCDTD